MAEIDDEKLSEEAKQLYRKTKVPHKFCPNCGTRNEADADRCSNCNKDISWMRIPEPVPYSEAPKEKPRSLPEEQKIFTPRAVLVISLVLALILGLILVIVLITKGKSAVPAPGLLLPATACALAALLERPPRRVTGGDKRMFRISSN
jgi:predicted nucleic acid-binding Zn ribbon protein